MEQNAETSLPQSSTSQVATVKTNTVHLSLKPLSLFPSLPQKHSLSLTGESSSSSPPPKRQQVTKVPQWPGTLPYNSFDPSGPSFPLYKISYADPLDSPVVTFIIGLERTPLTAHRAVLTEAAEYFVNLFESGSTETVRNKFELPKDNVDAWELLIEWCYEGEIPDFRKPNQRTVVKDLDGFLGTRIKLCCLAEQYGMKFLFNLTMDSILAYLRHGAPGPKVEWILFKEWSHYVHQKASKSSFIWRFLVNWYVYAVTFSKMGVLDNEIQYDLNDLVSLGYELHGLFSHTILTVRLAFAEFEDVSINEEPWDCSPCDWHLHTRDKADNSLLEASILECPGNISPNSLREERSNTSNVAYFLQTSTLWGDDLCYTEQIVRQLGIPASEVVKEVERLTRLKIAKWETKYDSFTLMPLELN